MADDQVLRRIDRSLARIDVHRERSNEHVGRGNRLFEDHRTFLRKLSLRQERVFGAMIERLDEQTREIREHRQEFVEESRAQRAALFRLLDRLDGGADPAGA
jgi:hypothetical protein